MSPKLKIIFMGTPEFAVPCLELLHQKKYPIPLVVTQPDRPKGRGRKLTPPPVKIAAARLGCEIIQPESIKNDTFADRLAQFRADVVVVIAYGRILSRQLLALPRLGVINVHASLLPKYRGPAPIQWTIINAEKETGVTTMFMSEGLDEGDILLFSTIPLTGRETSAGLHDRLAGVGADLLIDTLSALEKGNLEPMPQDHAAATYAPLIKKKDGRIDWNLPAHRLDAFIRGLTPWPGAFTFHAHNRLKILSAQPAATDTRQSPGTVLQTFPDELLIAAAKGTLSIREIQSASGKRLLTKDFLRGYALPPGTILG